MIVVALAFVFFVGGVVVILTYIEAVAPVPSPQSETENSDRRPDDE